MCTTWLLSGTVHYDALMLMNQAAGGEIPFYSVVLGSVCGIFGPRLLLIVWSSFLLAHS